MKIFKIYCGPKQQQRMARLIRVNDGVKRSFLQAPNIRSFYFQAPLHIAELIGACELSCVKHEQQMTAEYAAMYYNGGGIWHIAGYAHDGSDTLAAFLRAVDLYHDKLARAELTVQKPTHEEWLKWAAE